MSGHRSDAQPGHAAGWTCLLSGAVTLPLVVLGFTLSDPGPFFIASISTVISGGAGLVVVVHSRPRPSSAGWAVAIAAGMVGVVAATAVVLAALGVLAFVFSFGVPGSAEGVDEAEPVCLAITEEENSAVVDGASLEEVETVLARQLVLRDRYTSDSGAEIAVYEWQLWGFGCNQYVSYEFRDGRLWFRRWAPAS